MRNNFFIFLVPFFITGCGGFVVWPHTVKVTPEISGEVHFSGVPVKDASLYLHTKRVKHTDCQSSEHIKNTDSEGKFHFDEINNFKLIFSMGDPIYSWALCIEHEGKIYLGYHNHKFYRMDYSNKIVKLNCDFNASELNIYEERVICLDQ